MWNSDRRSTNGSVSFSFAHELWGRSATAIMRRLESIGANQCCLKLIKMAFYWVVCMNLHMRFAVSYWDRVRGLKSHRFKDMGEGEVLCLAPCRSIHTFGMRGPLDVAFLNRDGLVVSSYRNVMPNRILSSPDSCLALERYANDCSDWFEQRSRVIVALDLGGMASR